MKDDNNFNFLWKLCIRLKDQLIWRSIPSSISGEFI